MTVEHTAIDEAARPFARSPAVIASLLLHALVLTLLLYFIGAPTIPLPAVPVDLVQLVEETIAPAPQTSPPVAPSRESAPRGVATVVPRPPAPVPAVPPPPAVPSTPQPAPDVAPPPQADRLQTQLEALANLRAPNRSGTLGSSAAGDGTALQGGYSVKDLIRAQVQRRWSLNLEELGERNIVVSIHVVLERDGTVAIAEIVDAVRHGNDESFRSIAISARNAVILSSPLTLPAGISDADMDLTLNLNTRDVMR